MSISKVMAFVPGILPAGRIGAAIQAAMEATGLVEAGNFVRVSVARTLADGSQQKQQGLPLADIDAICDLSEEGLIISTCAGDPGPNWYYLAVQAGDPGHIDTQAPTAGVGEQMAQTLITTAGLTRHVESPEPEPFTDIGSDDAPASAVRSNPPTAAAPAGSDRRLRAFLTYRFGSTENEAAAAAIQHFLELENVEVFTGRSYEPRSINEKVADRLAGLDFLVLLIGVDGESSWGRDEISTARAHGSLVIPIVTDGAKFDPGLFGDLEYITVAPAHVGDALLPLLEALTYIRRRVR